MSHDWTWEESDWPLFTGMCFASCPALCQAGMVCSFQSDFGFDFWTEAQGHEANWKASEDQ